MNNYITSASVATRDGLPFQGAVSLVEERHIQSERAQMLAAVARIEARLELERALKRTSMATPTPITRQPGAMASRNPGRIHPAPLRDNDDAAGFDRVDRILSAAVQIGFILSAILLAVALAGGGA